MFLITWNYKEPNLGTAKGKKNNRLIFLFFFFPESRVWTDTKPKL